MSDRELTVKAILIVLLRVIEVIAVLGVLSFCLTRYRTITLIVTSIIMAGILLCIMVWHAKENLKKEEKLQSDYERWLIELAKMNSREERKSRDEYNDINFI